MKNIKKGIFITFILCLFLVNNINLEVYATQGKLKGATVCVGPDGNYYGQHSSDNHWHAASKTDNGYYALGNPLSYNPCNSSTKTSSSKSVVSSGNGSSNSSKQSSSNSSKKTNTSSVKKEEKKEVKSNEKPEIEGLDNKSVTSKSDGKTLSSKDIVKMFEIKVKDKEDGVIDFDNYLVSPSEIDLDEVGYHYITVYYKDKDENVIEKELTLEVEEESFFDKIFG